MEREFGVSLSCMNCKNRSKGYKVTHNCILCTVDDTKRNGRLICNLYEHSNYYGVISGEIQILNENERRILKEEV